MSPHFHSLVVVTYGRSGSTLLQGLLNTLPGVVVRGENAFFVEPLYRSDQRLSEFAASYRSDAASRGPRSPGFGADEIDEDRYRLGLSRLIRSQLQGASRDRPCVLGFKEIRWADLDGHDWAPFTDWLETVMPNLGYIVHTRKRSDVRASGGWPEVPRARFDRMMRRTIGYQRFLIETRPDRVYKSKYERLIADPLAEYQSLSEWLGIPTTPQGRRRWGDALRLRHSL